MIEPTQAQIEALGIEAIKDELDFQRSKGSAKAIGLEWALSRLTAAAEVGEPWLTIREVLDEEISASGRTVMLWLLEELTAKDAIDPNIVYPGKHDLLDFIFPGE